MENRSLVEDAIFKVPFNEDIPYYPDIKIEETGMHGFSYLSLTTYLRKKKGGKWYVWGFANTFIIPKDDSNLKLEILNKFHKRIYCASVSDKVHKIMLESESLAFVLDVLQKSEKKRLINIYGKKKTNS